MSVIKDIRAKIDVRLEKLEAQTEALEAQFDEGREEIQKRIDKQKEMLSHSAEKLEELAGDSAALAIDTGKQLHAGFDHLRVQLALGKAETQDLLRDQEGKIHEAITQIENRLSSAENNLEEDLAKESAAFIRIADKLRAELEAAQLQYALFRADHRDDVDSGKESLRIKVKELRSKLTETSHEAGERFEKFEKEIGEGLGHVRRAFMGLGKDD
jgi:hypothetical protein